MKKKINRYLVLIVFIVLTLIGLGIRYLSDTNSFLWELWGVIDTSFAVSLGVMAFLAYKEFIILEDEIKIYFNVNGREIDTGLSLLRKDCSRGEILGILGMMQRKTNARFHLDAKRLPIMLKEIQDIQKGNLDKVLVDMTEDDFNQYDIEIYQSQREVFDDN